MKKLIRSIVCAMMAIALSASSFLVLPAQASEQARISGLTLTQTPLRFTGKECTAEFYADLVNMDISINDDTVFEVVSSKARSGASALIVTNTINSEVTKDIFMALDEQGARKPISVVAEADEGDDDDDDVPVVEKRFRYGMDIFNDASFVFQVTALFDSTHDLIFVRPRHLQFICRYDPNDDFTVTDVRVDYSTEGYPCDNETTLLDGDNLYLHSMVISKSTVNANSYYSNARGYSTAGLLKLTAFSSHLVDVSYEVNGDRYFDMYDLTALVH